MTPARRIAAAAIVSLALAAGCSRAGPAAPGARPHILLVTIDTFRADRMTRSLTPALAQLADSGIRFANARTTVPLTLPAHSTILTGLLPPMHGVRGNGAERLSESQPTIAAALKAHGYRTAAVVGAFVLDRRFGLAAGFDEYDDRIARNPNDVDRLEAERPASSVVDRALAWLEDFAAKSDPSHPFFVWIHLYDPHAPYRAPAEFVARAQHIASGDSPTVNRAYDAEVMYADSQIARVFDWLRARGWMNRTLIAVAGDHGEGLGDHGERTHGMLLYDSTLRVPLVIAGPGVAAAARDDPVSLVDVAPTILGAAGVTVPVEMKGKNLVRLKRDAASEALIYAETEYPRVAGWSALQALTDGRWKTIRGRSSTELYDLERDPGERRDLAAAQPNTARAMVSRLDAIDIRGAAPRAATSTDAADRLRSLGYVTSSVGAGDSAAAPNPATTIAEWNEFEDALARLNARDRSALADLKRIASSRPDAPVFQMTYARGLKEAGQFDEALGVYRRAQKRWPADAMLLHDLAVAARDAAEGGGPRARALRDEALRAERAAIAAAPDNAAAHNGLGLLDVDANDLPAAAGEFDRATALDPTNASYWVNLGNARRGAHNPQGAALAFQHALDLEPANADALNGAGVLLVEAKRPAEAAPLFARAADAAPEFVEARLNLGIALQQSGDAKRAAEMYRRVLAAPGRHPREKEAAAHLLAALGAAR